MLVMNAHAGRSRYVRKVLLATAAAVALAVIFAVGPASGTATAKSTAASNIIGESETDQASVEAYARSIGASQYLMEAIPYYYDIAPQAGIRPEVLVAQSIVETGSGHYGGDSKPYNMAGVKKGGDVGDAPRDFERPATAHEGVRMHVNHMAAYTGQQTVGTPHDRYYDARSAQQARGYWLTQVEELGAGTWATDSSYSPKIVKHLDDMQSY